MAKRIKNGEIVKRLASRLSIDTKVSEEYLDALLELFMELLKLVKVLRYLLHKFMQQELFIRMTFSQKSIGRKKAV